jgi:hypothetical protein
MVEALGSNTEDLSSRVLGYAHINWRWKAIAYIFGVVVVIFGLIAKALPEKWFDCIN